MTSRVAVVTGLLVLVATVGFSASTLVGRQGFSTVLDGWLQPTAYVLCAALAVLRPLLRRQDRLVWGLVAGALSARAVAFVLYLSLVRTQDPRPYPSVADAGWLLSCALLAAALLVLAASRSSRLPVTLVLDGAVGACAVGSLAWLVLPGVVAGSSPSGTPVAALVTNVLYPAADVALLLSVLGMLVASRWRAPPAVWVLGAGIVGFAVLDAWYLWELSQGTFRPATPLSGLSLVVTAVMAVSGWVPDRRRPGEPPAPSVSLYVPAALAATCLGLLVRAAFVPAPGGAVLLAAVGVAVTVVRTVLGFRDVRHLSVARQEARTDDLTGLANRRALSEALDRRLSGRTSPRPFALLVLDLDGFKSVNDTLGHHAGDELLVRVAGRLHVGMRPDDLVVRIGGDEFAVLLDDTEEDTASDVAVRLRQACRGPFTVGGRTITAEASVGIALFPQDGRTADLLLQSADNAMYAAKQEGTGQSLYRADFQQAGRDRLESKQELQRALAARELVVHYQPQVRLSDGAVIGLEALVRWQHPTRGLLAPPGFLPQAERTGLMRELTLDVLGQSLAQWRRWQQSGVLTTIAVNLSVSDLLDRSFPDQVAAALSRHGVPGSSLVLELTEDLLLADPRRGRAVIDELAQQGVRVQVDDYGTGYSTLGYLRDLPSLAGLKLDRSFVVGLLDDRRTRAIVESTVRLAADLGLELVAEGVETPAVRDLLRELGCPLAQGFLFGRPVPPQDVRFALEDRAPRPTASWRSPTRD